MSKEKEIRLHGFPICSGIAIASPFFFYDIDEKIPEVKVTGNEIEKEVDRFWRAIKSSEKDLEIMKSRLLSEGGKEGAAILSSHIEMMRDPEITHRIEREIRSRGKNTEYVFKSVVKDYEKQFSKINDQFFRERVKDFQDISRRIISHLRKKERRTLASLNSKVIVFADALSPSDTAEARSEFIEAFVTKSGSETSHVAIMAREKGIPFVSNVDFPDLNRDLSPIVIVDGRSGHVIINPKKNTLKSFSEEKKRIIIQVQGLQMNSISPAMTVDGHQIKVTANIEMINELDQLIPNGGEGVGLFRSEYLFLARDGFPSEEDQFLVYKKLVENVHGLPVVIRTFDIGGDKVGDFHPSRYERNPYLGCRAIRLMLREKVAFKAQIRAILRASAFGEANLLFPMISHLTELREAKALVEESMDELVRQGIPFSRKIPIGCMIEVPSAALICDEISKECDFLSIGTNDLVQYTLAVDRGDPSMRALYTPAHPAVLRLMKMAITAAIRHRLPISTCGEIAADPKFIPLLLGLGVNELSVAVPSIPLIKNVIRQLSLADVTHFADDLLKLSTADEVQEALQAAFLKLE